MKNGILHGFYPRSEGFNPENWNTLSKQLMDIAEKPLAYESNGGLTIYYENSRRIKIATICPDGIHSPIYPFGTVDFRIKRRVYPRIVDICRRHGLIEEI